MKRGIAWTVVVALLLILMGCGDTGASESVSTKTSIDNPSNGEAPVASVVETEDEKDAKKDLTMVNNDRIKIELDYFNGQRIDDPNFYLAIDVSMFDQIDGGVILEFDITVDEELDESNYNVISLMTLWEESAFYSNLSGYDIDLSLYKGQTTTVTTVISKLYKKEIEDAGTLIICGHGACINKVTISGKRNADFEPIVASVNSPVAVHGRLHVDGQNIVDEKGDVVRILGTCIEGTYGGPYINPRTFKYLNEEWGINTIRVMLDANMPYDNTGFCDEHCNKEMYLHFIDNQIDYCIQTGIYAIVTFADFYNPLDTLDGAQEFFTHILDKYGDCPNILYEIGNEPEYGEWEHMRECASVLVPLIREKSPDALIICPSEGWAQKTLICYENPIPYDNVIYTYHLYTNPFQEIEYYELKKALEGGLPVILTEYNVCDATGGQARKNDYESDKKWYQLLEEYEVSYVYGGIAINYEEELAICGGPLPSSKAKWDFTEEDMGESMKYFYHKIRKDAGKE